MTSLRDAIEYLYELTYVQDKWRSTKRMDALAGYCIEEFESRGVTGWDTEVRLDAFARDKQWDLVHETGGKPRIAITLKSILKNLAGTVPNRTDDLIGEVADLQMRYPEVVIGYVVIVDTANTDAEPNRGEWAQTMKSRLNEISGRRPPFWGRGTIEDSAVIMVEFDGPDDPKLLTDETETDAFFNTIVEQYRDRYEQSGQQSLTD